MTENPFNIVTAPYSYSRQQSEICGYNRTRKGLSHAILRDGHLSALASFSSYPTSSLIEDES